MHNVKGEGLEAPSPSYGSLKPGVQEDADELDRKMNCNLPRFSKIVNSQKLTTAQPPIIY